MIVSIYTKETAELTPMSENIDPDTGVRIKGTKRNIKGFFSGRTKMFRNELQEGTVSDQIFVTEELINIGDLINGREVKAVRPVKQLYTDTIIYYEVLL